MSAAYLQRRAAVHRQMAEFRAWLDGVKSQPCFDCGHRYPPYVMHFDHRDPAQKLFEVGTSRGRSQSSIDAEIEKCDVVCANCHAERTFGGVRA